MTIARKHIIGICVLFILGIHHPIHNQDANAEEADKKPSPKWLVEKITTVSGGNTNIQNYSYNEKGKIEKLVVSTQGPNVQSTSTHDFVYNEAGNNIKKITTIISPKSKIEITQLMLYDSNNFLIKTSTTTSSNGRLSTSVHEYENNSKGKPVKTVTIGDKGNRFIRFQGWDACDKITKIISGSNQTEMKYEYAGGKDCVALSISHITNNQLTMKTEFEYSSTGKPSKMYLKNFNPNLKTNLDTTTVSTYDENDNLIKVVQSYTKSGEVLSTSTRAFKKFLIND